MLPQEGRPVAAGRPPKTDTELKAHRLAAGLSRKALAAQRSVRKVRDGETTDDLFAFLTTDANADVAPIHPKAMPVILDNPREWEHWLTASWADTSALQRPLSSGVLTVEARQVPR